MDNFEEKLNQVLSSPETMDKVMMMMKSLGGAGESETEQQADSQQTPDLSGLLSGFMGGGDGGIDPAMMGKLLQLWGVYNQGDPQKAGLLTAMKPYLRKERADRVDRALQTLKLTKVAREALGSGLLNGFFGKK